MPRLRPLALVVVLSAPLAGCSSADPAQAGAAGRQAKQVSVVAVQRDAVRRSVDVVGKPTAAAQVTVSSKRRHGARILAHWSDAGRRSGCSSDDTRCSRTSVNSSRRRSRAQLAQTAQGPPASAEPENTPDVDERTRARPGTQCVRSRKSALKARARRATGLRRRPGRAADETGGSRGGAAERPKPEREHPGGRGGDEAVRTPGARHRDSRALRRVCERSLVIRRVVRLRCRHGQSGSIR